MSESQARPQSSTYFQIGALFVALAGIVLGLVGSAEDGDHFFQVYLFAFLFWLQLALGCLALLMLATVFNSRWSYSIRRLAGAGARTLPLLALLSIPLLVSQDQVFPWAAEGVELEDGKEIYLTEGFFAIRTVIYFVIWIALAYGLTEWSYMNDTSGDEAHLRRTRQLSIAGIVLYFLTATFAAFDWSLSLNYESFSSIYGWLAMSQQGLAAMAFLILVLALFWDRAPMAQVTTPRAISDLAALLLVSLLVWAYLNFMQYIVMWSGNIPDKVNWYAQRTTGGWDGLAQFMILFHAIAFVLLLVPGLQRMRWVLVSIAGALLALRLLEIYWIVMPPSMAELDGAQSWDPTLIFGFGGLWVAFFVWSLTRVPLVPVNDPGYKKLASSS